MKFGRIFVTCLSAAIACAAPAVADTAATLSYMPAPPACTTTDAQRPVTTNRPNSTAWMQPPAQSQLPIVPPRGENMNDIASRFGMFPMSFAQPSDSIAGPKVAPNQPSTFANGTKAFPVSTCTNTPS